MRSRSLRAPRLLFGTVTAIAVLSTGVVAASQQATAAPGEGPACPLAYPATDLELGDQVTGATTAGSYRRGATEFDSRTTPEPFTGYYRGALEDPAGDLLVFELEGSRITRPDGSVDAGIWSGLSGSPLYAADGRLVGAVSYSFSGSESSIFAGVTPAADLYDLLAETQPAPAARITASRTEQHQLVRAGVPTATAASGAVRLGPDAQISGLGNRLSSRTLRTIAAKSGRALPRLAVGGGTQNADIDVVAGGNVALSDSYGSIALYSVGTAAAVCDDVVIGYGHAADWAPATRTIHGASTVIVQADGAFSYKMVNLGAPQGSLLHDRLSGVTGRLGTLPTTAPVTVTSTGPKPRTSTSQVSNPDALSYVVASQAYRDAALTLDELTGGRAELSWTIDYTREDGRTGSFRRSQRYASAYSVADEVSSDVAADIDAILGNGFEKVTVTGVTVRQQVARGYQAYELGAVEVARKGRWRQVPDRGIVKLVPGKNLRVRVSLEQAAGAHGTAPISKVFKLAVPKRAVRAKLKVNAHGASFWDDLDDWGLFEDEMLGDPGLGEDPTTGPDSLDALLASLAATPRQDRINLKLAITTASGRPRTRTAAWTAPQVVSGKHVVKLKRRAGMPPVPRLP